MPKRTAPVEEVPVALVVGGRAETLLRATPAALRELAAGHLLALGRVRSAADIASLDVDGAPGVRAKPKPPLLAYVVRAGLAASAPAPDPTHPSEAVHALECEGCRVTLRAGAGPVPPPDAETFGRLLGALYAHADRYADTGGVHAAGLSDGEKLLFPMEDVGRHNAVDKTIGAALLAGVDMAELGLVVSSRISAEIAYKAARAGLSWVASRSLPTTLAVSVAEAAGLPLVARAGKSPTLFP